MIPHLQDNVLLPDDFAENIYHIGNAHDMHAIIQDGLNPVGKSQRDRQSVFFTAVNPIYGKQDLEEVQYDLDTQNHGVQKYLEKSPKYSMLVQSEARSKKRIAVPSNPIARNRSFQHTTCDLY